MRQTDNRQRYRNQRRTRWTFLVFCLVAGAGVAHADGIVTGHGRFERIKGRPAAGHVELYESNLFLSRDGSGPRGPSARLGAPAGQAPRGDGYYRLSVPAGTYSLLVNQPLFYIRPTVIEGITVRDGRTATRNVDLPIDYSTYTTDTWTGFSRTWYQTFVATGSSITGVSWKLAGTNADEIECAILADDGSADPSAWPRVSAQAAKRDRVGAITDNWVRWRSGEVPTEPGRRYAVRLTGTAGGDRAFAVFHRAKDAQSYADGRAHDSGGSPQGFDLNITVFSDADGTATLLNKTTEGLGELQDGNFAGRWGQTFVATIGTSLAGVDVWAAGADRNWDLDFTFTVRRDGPSGPQVGPTKTTRAAFQAFGAGLHGVSYSRGEVPLVPGETYYVEFTNPEGFNPYVMTDPLDRYDRGVAWRDGSRRSAIDVSMTILTWTEPGGTVEGRVRHAGSGAGVGGATVTIVEIGRSTTTTGLTGAYSIADVPAGDYTLRVSKPGYRTATRAGVVVTTGETVTVDVDLEPADCDLEFTNPSFESGLRGWTVWGEGRGETVSGRWFADIEAVDGERFWGNAINGCCLDEGGLFQRVCAIPGHRYRLRASSNLYWISGDWDDAVNRIGIDPGGESDPHGDVEWSAWHRQPREATAGWRRLEVEAVATGPVLTVFLGFRQRPDSGDQWRICCFDAVEIEDLDASSEPEFVRSDCDASAETDISDAIFLLAHLFTGGAAPGCDDACDANDDGAKDISDATWMLNYLFLGGDPPPDPFPECGADGTPDDGLACAVAPCVRAG